jgi:tripartite-type tricarboxylate transporter receptor subunit TctC
MTVSRVFRWVQFLAYGVCLLAIAGTLPAEAQAYPRQTVKIVVPFPAGGGIDVIARIVGPKLSEALGQPVIVENRAGAGGAIGATAVAKAPADGYTLLFGTGSTHGTNAVVYTKLPYDPMRDFAPVVLVGSSPLVLVVNPSLPPRSVNELIEFARAKPGELSYGSFGTGSINHLAGELFNSMANIKTNHIPYRGSAPALTDLIGGRIHYTFDGVQTSIGFIRAGTLRLLAVTAPQRTALIPDAPTVAESGVSGFDAILWNGFFAPANTPKPVVDLLNSKMNDVLSSPDVKEAFGKLGIEPMGGKPDALAKRVETELRKWTEIAREKNISIDAGR